MLSDQMDLCFLEAGKPDCMAHRRQMLPLALDAHSLYSLLRVPGHWEVVLSAGSSLCLLSSISEPASHRLCGVLSARAQQPVITPDPKYTALLLLANCATGNLLPGPVNLCFPLGGWRTIRPQWKEESGLRCCTGIGCMVVTNSMSLFHSFKQMVSWKRERILTTLWENRGWLISSLLQTFVSLSLFLLFVLPVHF